jgi:hypothetical protein
MPVWIDGHAYEFKESVQVVVDGVVMRIERDTRMVVHVSFESNCPESDWVSTSKK